MNIFVANLNYKIRKENLEAIFAEYGEVVSAKIIFDRDTKRSKGYGFVEIADDAQAERAIADLNGAEWEGKVIMVKKSEARPGTETPTPQ
ncbi:MAG: RNA-binding protein [Bacteroidales bacterium]|nr:RNA-binding protein [Bacteroidales bacterium]